MKPLICDLCGGSLTIEQNSDFATCNYCGVQYSTEHLRTRIQEIKGTIEITTGEQEKERLLKNAETLMKLQKYLEAKDIYRTVQKNYPSDYLGWYGEFEAFLNYYISQNTSFVISNFDQLNTLVVTALKLCKENIKTNLLENSNNLWKAYLSLENTKRRFLEDLNDPYDDTYYNFKKQTHPQNHIFILQLEEWYLNEYMKPLWYRSGCCSHCGGKFTGILSRKCIKCGKTKDY